MQRSLFTAVMASLERCVPHNLGMADQPDLSDQANPCRDFSVNRKIRVLQVVLFINLYSL